MTASHSLSPQQIERVVDAAFGEAALAEKLDSEGTHLRVAETSEDIAEETVVGYVEGTVDEDTGELAWLFVDPEHRGKGVGTDLFESMREALDAAGASSIRAVTLDANTEGAQFFERFGLERVEERDAQVGDESLVEIVFAESSAAEAGEETEQAGDAGGEQLPDTETDDDTTTATTEDGETVFVARDEQESGTDAPFFVVYTDDAHEDRYGYYCANCGSLDVTMDDTERLECPECGNEHAERSSEGYDDSYL